MAISDAFLPEFEQEAATTRKCLERIPQDKLAWKPHEKSMAVGDLGGHIVNLASTWAAMTMTRDVFDLNPPGGKPLESPKVTSVAALVADFDKGIAAAKAAMKATDDAKWMANWSLANGGRTLMTMPRVAVMRGFVMNHIVHHRGQLSVYLRLLGVPVPSIYGPSADERPMG